MRTGESLVLCGECEGEGRKEMRRCPTSMADDDLRAAFHAYGWLQQHGAFPAPGSLGDQAASFIWFCDAVDSEIAATRRDEEDSKERMNKILEASKSR